MADQSEAPDAPESEADPTAVEPVEAETPAGDDDALKARAGERRARKKAEAALAVAQAKLKELEEAGASETEKAIAKAREEARKEAMDEVTKERKAERLELSVTRIATSGVKLGDETVKFADPDDALVNLERAIARNEVDDVFDEDGNVQADALKVALAELLQRKPHLQAGAVKAAVGDADGGKGAGPGADEESLTPEQRFKRLTSKK